MILRPNESARTVLAPAKLNLFLDVLGRRPDGYHELKTLMVPVRLYDSLTIWPAAGTSSAPAPISFQVVDAQSPQADLPQPSIPIDRGNLVVRALELLRERSGSLLGEHICLTKRIPAAAGMVVVSRI